MHYNLTELQVAVGGVGGFFPDAPDKPWSNSDGDSAMKVRACVHQAMML
jgi:hypothetical protein